MRHEAGRPGPVPVPLTWLDPDRIAGADHLDRTTLALDEAGARRHVQHLADRVAMPDGARARREMDRVRAKPRGQRWHRDLVEPCRAGQPFRGSRLRLGATARDFHEWFLRSNLVGT